MIQLNLLPDVKLEYIKPHQAQRLVTSVSILVTIASVVILGLLLSFDGLQKKHIHDLNNDIAKYSNQIQGKPGINKVLTVQNQLDSLTGLHDKKPAVSELFTYLNQVTPANVDINN